LGVLDASEIPPTFRAPREQVQGLIAGGRQALWSAVEGAEDDVQAGANAIGHRGLGEEDVLVGIAASGRTPFVWGALHEANTRGAFTVLLCFNPAMKTAAARLGRSAWRPRLVIAPDVGPEVLTGSTRLKAGTATKLVLNMITTLAMTRAGKVISNLEREAARPGRTHPCRTHRLQPRSRPPRPAGERLGCQNRPRPAAPCPHRNIVLTPGVTLPCPWIPSAPALQPRGRAVACCRPAVSACSA
jgi:hypothetical protein